MAGGISRDIYHTPHTLHASTTLSSPPSSLREWLVALGQAYPCAAGYASGCWSGILRQDLSQRRFPEVPTSGIRKASNVFGLIDYFSGRFFSKARTGRFHSESDATFVLDVLAHTTQHVFVMQDGAHYHTSQAIEAFFVAHGRRGTKVQLPAYSPNFNPIGYLWKNVKKMAMPLKHLSDCHRLQAAVDKTLRHFAHTPHESMTLMTRYCDVRRSAARR